MRDRALLVVSTAVLALTGALGVGSLLVPLRVALDDEPLAWTATPVPTDAGGEQWDFPRATLHGGVRAEDGSPPDVALGDSTRSLELSDVAGLGVIDVAWQPDSGVAVVVLDEQTEGAGPELDFLISLDSGEHWEHRALRKPIFVATLDELRIDWPLIRVVLSLDTAAPIDPLWQRWPSRVLGHVLQLEGRPGVYLAESSDGARHFTLTAP